MIDIKSFSKPKKSGNGSGGGSSSVTYISGIASEADHATRADKAKKAEVAEQANVANRATSAQTASYASKAGEVDIESETLQKFLRKDDPAEGEENVAEEVHRKVDFKKAATFEEAADMLKGFTAHELAAFLKGFTIAGQFGIDEYGDMILNTIKSLEYNNAAEQGFSIEKEDPNRDEYHQYITNLTVWGKMTMNELEVMKRTYAGGTIYLSPAGGKIAKVVPVYWDDEKSGWKETASDAAAVGWKCYLLADDGTAATENLWREGDQVRCQTMGRIAAGGIGQGSAANKSYWRTILEHGVSQQNEKIYDQEDHELFGGQRFAWIVIGKHSVQLDEYAEENAPAETRDIPEEGDVIVLDGSRTDPDRQNVFLLESHGSYAPRLVGYHGIDSYSHANKDVCDVSPKGVQVRSEYFKLLAQGSNTSTVEIPNFRGEWDPNEKYYKNDQVSHNNAIWTCIKDTDFQAEPTDGGTYWRKEVYGVKGDKGDKGDKGTDGADGIDGTNGANGEDAISILVEDAPLIFDAGSNGIVPSNITKSAKVKVMKGNVNVTNAITAASSNDEISVNCKSGVTMRQDSSDPFLNVYISGKNIGTTWLDENDHSKGVVSVTSGYATGSFAYNNKAYKFHVPFEVNVSKFTGQLILTTDKFSTEMSKLSGKHNTLSDNYDRLAADLKTSSPSILTNYTSKIEQTARQISLTVSEKAMGRRNMLPGSALRKMGEGWGAALVGDWLDGTYTVGYYGDQGILTSDGIGGSNCFKAKCYYDGNTIQYPGMRWNGEAGVRNIKIQSGKKYTISAWVKCDRTDMNIALECLWQPGEKTGSNERKGAVPSNGFYHYLTEVNTWTLITTTIDTTNAPYSYIEVNLFITHRQSGVTATAWFCRPMMEEGDTYNGWTPSPQDYDYIGGNLLDNTASLSLGGNLTYLYGTIIKNGYEPDINASYAKAPANSYAELVKFGEGTNDPIALSPNTDYIFSFWAKGTSLTAYAYRNNNNAEMVTEDCNGNFRSSTEYDDGNTYFTLTNQWKRYWVHWRTKSRTDFIPQMILLRTSSEAWIAKPKLEVGCTMTDWTEKRTDMVDRQALLATGIDITNGKITITANNTIFRDNNGTTIALFTGGKINASLIDADQIEVKHLWAKSNDGASKVGYFGNTEESACKLSDGTLAPLFIGGDTAAKSPFYVTSKGAMHATSGYIGGFSIINDGIICSAAGNEMRINTSYIKFHNEQHGITNIVGANWGYGIDYTAQQIIVEYDHPTKLTYNGSQATANQMNVGLYVSASGTKHQLSRDSWLSNSTNPCGNHAIFCDKGDFAGFRPCFRKITASQTLTKYDVFLEVDGTWKQHNDVTGKDTEVSVGSVTITLPKDPEIGQMYWILRGSKYNYTLKTTDGTLIDYPGGKGTSVTLTTYRELVCVIFNGEYWRLIWRIGVA